MKYHENLKVKASPHKSRYDQIAEEMNCFNPDPLKKLRKAPLQQIWRDHLLLGSVLKNDSFDDGFFVFLYPQGNYDCKEAVALYRHYISDSQSFEDWTLEQVTSAIKEHVRDGWIDILIDRYLNCNKIDQIV